METYILTPSCNKERHAATFQASLLSTSNLRSETPRACALGRRVDDDPELSIFEAEHYFEEGLRHDCVKRQPAVPLKGVPEVSRDSSVSSADGGRFGRYGLYCSTPAASSEASWNSQTGLLYNPHRGVPGAVTVRASKDRRRPPASPGRRLFSRSCPCSGKKSIDVKETRRADRSNVEFDTVNTTSSTTCFNAKSQSFGRTESTKEIKDELGVIEEMTSVKITPGNWAKGASFLDRTTFRFSPEKLLPTEITHRIVNCSRGPFIESFSFPVLSRPQSLDEVSDEPPRDSLEVFRPREELPFCARKSVEVQRLAAVMPYSGEAEPHLSISYVSSPKPRQVNDDAASDASSDLFEIESFSTSHGTSTYRRRDSLDELDARRFSGSGVPGGLMQIRRVIDDTAATASLATSDCYPPSEASVDWSVATAEGPDGTSAASDAGDLRHGNTGGGRCRPLESGGWRKNAHGGSVLSCRSEKAVHVAPNSVRFAPPVVKRGSDRVNLPISPR